MKFLSQEASLVHKVLLERGIENPLISSTKNINIKKRRKLISQCISKIMTLLNLDIKNDSISETPNRIVKMYIDEIFSGLDYINFPKITMIKNHIEIEEIITVRKISLTSTCEHHFVIIDGKATISYLPKNKIIGLSKINRIANFFASRPQLQERLTKQILVSLQTLLETNNVAVSIDAIHHCVKSRGIKDNSITTTTSLGGLFQTSKNMRQEFLFLLLKNK